MVFPYIGVLPDYNCNDSLVIRKPILDEILNELRMSYQLSSEELSRYVIIHPSLVPNEMMVDLLIHALDLYQEVISYEELLPLIESTVPHSLLLEYRNGNTKIANRVIGIMLSKHKNLSPRDINEVLKKLY